MKKEKATHSAKQPEKRIKAIMYTREGEGGHSRKEQEDIIRHYCSVTGMEIVKEFHDHGPISKRPEFDNFISALKSGDIKADFFLFTSIDRVVESLFELIELDAFLTAHVITGRGILRVQTKVIAIEFMN